MYNFISVNKTLYSYILLKYQGGNQLAYQNNILERTLIQNNILDLEKKYFKHIEDLVNSPNFLNNLLDTEAQIQNNYSRLKDVWNVKNLLKIPAERLVRYNIYKEFDFITGYYASPVSSDIGVKTEEAILNIDIKTIDTKGNSTDVQPIIFEHNQFSFKNKNLDPYNEFECFPVSSNLPSIDPYTDLPILTYVVKFIYTDNKKSFSLYRGNKHYSIAVACIPNGELSNLFDYDIVSNFKDYKYYNIKSDPYFLPKTIVAKKDAPPNFTKPDIFYDYVQSAIDIDANWTKIYGRSKPGYYDPNQEIPWFLVERGKGPNKIYTLEPVKKGNAARIPNSILKERYDSNNDPWCGYKTFTIK